MLEKLDERHRKWLVSDEQLEIDTLVAEGLGEWADLNQMIIERIANLLDFSSSFDHDLTANGSAAEKKSRKKRRDY